ERLNDELERRIEEQVVEIVRRAREVEALNLQLAAQVQERSQELARALRLLSQREETRLAAGATIGDRVEVVREIGSGGMGTVYLGHDRLTGQQVAVK